MADRNDIRIWNNAAWAGEAEILDGEGNARDLTGATFQTEIRASAVDASPVLATLESGDGHALSDTPTDGLLYYSISLEIAESLDPGLYYYDTLMTVGGNDPERITGGTIRVLDGVTLSS